MPSKAKSKIDASHLASMAHAMAGEQESEYVNTNRLISNAAAKRILKAAGARRVGKDVTADVTDAIHPDKYGIVHKVFRDSLDDLSEKALFVTLGERMKTLMPRHIRQVATILGVHNISEGLPKVSIAPIKRRIQQRSTKGIRLNPEAVKMLATLALERTIRHLRSGVGLAAHETDRKTVNTRDIQNAELICQNFPQK